MQKKNKVEVWDLWIKSLMLRLYSFDQGKTWKGIRLDFWPFYESKPVSWVLYKKRLLREEVSDMKINEVAKIVTLREGKKVSISIAQVKEVLRILNQLTAGAFYQLLRKI